MPVSRNPVLDDPEQLGVVPMADVGGGQVHSRRIHGAAKVCSSVSIRSVAQGAGFEVELSTLTYNLIVCGQRVFHALGFKGDHDIFSHVG
jgi:hypothetical protein